MLSDIFLNIRIPQDVSCSPVDDILGKDGTKDGKKIKADGQGGRKLKSLGKARTVNLENIMDRETTGETAIR